MRYRLFEYRVIFCEFTNTLVSFEFYVCIMLISIFRIIIMVCRDNVTMFLTDLLGPEELISEVLKGFVRINLYSKLTNCLFNLIRP